MHDRGIFHANHISITGCISISRDIHLSYHVSIIIIACSSSQIVYFLAVDFIVVLACFMNNECLFLVFLYSIAIFVKFLS